MFFHVNFTQMKIHVLISGLDWICRGEWFLCFLKIIAFVDSKQFFTRWTPSLLDLRVLRNYGKLAFQIRSTCPHYYIRFYYWLLEILYSSGKNDLGIPLLQYLSSGQHHHTHPLYTLKSPRVNWSLLPAPSNFSSGFPEAGFRTSSRKEITTSMAPFKSCICLRFVYLYHTNFL